MKLLCRKKIALDSRKDAIVIPVYKNMPSIRGIAGKKIDDELRIILESDYFNYEEKEVRSFYVDLNKKLKKIYLVNIPKEIESAGVYRELGAKAVKIFNDDQIGSVSVITFEDIYNEKKDFSSTTAFIEGMLCGMYSFDRYKTKKIHNELMEAEFITNISRLKNYIDSNASEWNAVFRHQYMAKDLVNTPSNEMTPAHFAAFVKDNAHPEIEVEIWDKKRMEQENLNLVVSVGQGSTNEPYFIKLKYNGAPATSENIALVGKGVTFDSGGTNLKPSNSMEEMKADMGGAAVIFAVTNLIAEQKLPVNVNSYIPLAENIIGMNALKPGDVVRSYSGKAVEILNTDAEGRLILADALYMATKTDPEIIVDLATLTGACVVALGDCCAGLFSNRKFLSKYFADAASKTGEDVWELPLFENYASRLKSSIADLANIPVNGRNAGSITAALFLKEFVENYPWVHLDIAGPAFLDKPHAVFGSQATGFGLRLLYQFIKSHYCEK